MASSGTGVSNKQIFKDFFEPIYDIDKISDDTIEQFFSSDGTKLNYENGVDTEKTHIRIDCRGVVKQVDEVWHLFVRSTRTSYRNNYEATPHSFNAYDFHKDEATGSVMVQGGHQSLLKDTSSQFVVHPTRVVTHHMGLRSLLKGMEKNDPDLKGEAADPVIPGGTILDHGFREVFQHVPELIPEETEATPEDSAPLNLPESSSEPSSSSSSSSSSSQSTQTVDKKALIGACALFLLIMGGAYVGYRSLSGRVKPAKLEQVGS